MRETISIGSTPCTHASQQQRIGRVQLSNALMAGLAMFGAVQAHAQSGVRIYGTIDASLATGKSPAGRLNTVGASNNYPSKLGFAGTEDLGGGLSANFQLEGGLNTDTGSGVATNSNNQTSGAISGSGFVFNRWSWVGLRSNQWGEVRLGRMYTPSFIMYNLYDPYFGGGLGTSQSAVGGIGLYGNPGGLRSSNAAVYRTPNFSGLSGELMHARGENPKGGAAPQEDGNYSGGRVQYSAHGLDVGLALAKYKLAAVGDIDEGILGAKYKMGAFTVNALYMRDSTGAAGNMRGYLLGGTYTNGPWELRASYSTSERKNISGATIADARKLSVSSTYYLSKRTSLYAIATRLNNKSGAAFLPMAGSAVAATNGNVTVFALGVTHNF